MKTRRSSIAVAVSSLLVVALLLTLWSSGGLAWAQQPPQSSGDAPAPATLPLSPTGDGQPANLPSTAPGMAEAGLDIPQGTNSPAVSFSYYRMIGTAFQPRKSSTLYDYSANGCVYQTGGTDMRFQAPLLLPDGATIKYLRIYYIDSAAQDLTAWITRYQPGSTSSDLTFVTSAGTGGYGTALSAEITHTVDLTNWAYTLIWAPGVSSSANQFCGVRVAYYAPTFFGSFMPLVQRN